MISRVNCVWLAAIVVIALVYSLGLSGSFLLDDYATLPYLEQWGDLNGWDKLTQFISSGFTGPTGRPVALLTFAAQAEDWPNSPRYFLLINVLIHLVNAGLLFLLTKKIASIAVLPGEEIRSWLPVVVSLLWAAHPFLVSSVLYIVQRMVLLSTLFNLLAIVAYLGARNNLDEGRRGNSLIWLTLAGVAAFLALLSKENAVLIPLQLLLLELFFGWQDRKHSAQLFKWLFWLGLVIPSTLLVLYIFKDLIRNIFTYVSTGEELSSRRAFTMFERLMTEARIMGDYLSALILPKAQTAGVFHDGYLISRGLLHPVSTIIWVLIHTMLVTGALIIRKRMPIVALGILWFYLNHLVESTVIMLELKFEHRNYLPSIGIALAISYLLFKAPVSKPLKMACISLPIIICTMLLGMRTSLWGQPEKAALVWAEENPRSVRALENAALIFSREPENFAIVSGLLRAAYDRSGGDPVLQLKYMSYVCETEEMISLNYSELGSRLAQSALNWQIAGVLEVWLDKVINNQCGNFDLSKYQELLLAIKENPNYMGTSIPLAMDDLYARSELVLGNGDNAAKLYTDIQYEVVNLGMIMRQAWWLATYGEFDVAIQHLSEGIERSKADGKFILLQAEEMRTKILNEKRKNE